MLHLPHVRAVLAGFGFLGNRISIALSQSGYEVSVTRRKASPDGNGIAFVGCDLTVAAPDFTDRNFSAAVFCLAPGSRDAALYERTYCHAQKNFLAGINADHYVYISSTAVYPDVAGDYAEDSGISDSDRARILIEAERLALEHPRAVVLRLAGLYSDERRIYQAGIANYSEDKIVHFIHVNDAALAVVHALKQRLTGVYNVHDGNPMRRSEILRRLGFNAPGMPGFQQRKISAEKFWATGFRPDFNNYFTGIGAS